MVYNIMMDRACIGQIVLGVSAGLQWFELVKLSDAQTCWKKKMS